MNLRSVDSPLSCGDAILLTTIVLASFGHWIGAGFCVALYLLGRSRPATVALASTSSAPASSAASPAVELDKPSSDSAP